MDRLPAAAARRLTALVALTLVVAACSPAPSAPSSPGPSSSSGPASPSIASPSPSASPAPSASAGAADVQALTAEISSQVSALRGLSILSPIQSVVVTEAQALDLIRTQFRSENSTSFLLAEEGMYKRLGLLPQDASLERIELDLIGSQVLGFYLPTEEKLYVVARSGGIGPTERYTMAHEIVHALQDQHFDLRKVLADANDQGDRTLATHAITEGDATLAGTLWAAQHFTPQDLATLFTAGTDPASQEVLARTPAIIKEPQLFLYAQGLQLVMALRQQGGWAAVDKGLQAPPVSTEQVLHPEKYLAHEQPVPVSLPAGLAEKLGQGWNLALQDTFGELQLRIWLQSSASSASLATDAAAGWGGDRVGYLTGPDGKDAVIMWTAWDAPADADQFVNAAGRLAADGASPGTVIRVSDRQVVVIIASQSLLLDQVARAAGFPAPQ